MDIYVTKTCRRCNGSGEIDCSACGGEGYSWSGGQGPYCGGLGWETCPDCNGDGHIEEYQGDHDSW